jgi:hypothetical protein
MVFFAAHTRPRSSARPLRISPHHNMQMKRIVCLVYLLIPSGLLAAIPMARVASILDSHTISIERDGQRIAVALAGVDVPPVEEAAATEYLHRLLDRAWVYVEDGNVYRSPDALYINGEMQRHAWSSSKNMRYLGPSNPGPPRPKQLSDPGKAASPSKSPRRARVRRSPARARP